MRIPEKNPEPGTSKGGNSHIQMAREKADNFILNAEQHRATVNAPPGMFKDNSYLVNLENGNGQRTAIGGLDLTDF